MGARHHGRLVGENTNFNFRRARGSRPLLLGEVRQRLDKEYWTDDGQEEMIKPDGLIKCE